MSGININLPATLELEEVYKECRRNHAASLGKESFDGCAEFLKSDEDGTIDSMLCVACGCHRSFHRKETIYNPITQFPSFFHVPVALWPSFHAPFIYGGFNARNNTEVDMVSPKRKKRTTFTPEQKNQMLQFAERLGWRTSRANKEEIRHFCMEMGISRQMFMIWMSNNRHRVVEKDATTASV